MTNAQKIIALILGFGILILGLGFYSNSQHAGTLGSVNNSLDTFSSGVTNSTTSVATSGTQIFASVSKLFILQNNTVNQLSCYLDTTGLAAGSSNVTIGSGLQVGSTTVKTVAFGECGSLYSADLCIPFKGALNCKSNATTIISTVSK